VAFPPPWGLQSQNVEFLKTILEHRSKRVIKETPGIVVQDNTDTNTYPMPFMHMVKDECFVGRIRRDEHS